MERRAGATRTRSRNASRAGPTRRPRERGPVDICRLRVPLPGSAWIAEFSRIHPELAVEVLSRLDLTPHRSLTEIRLRSPEPISWKDELESLPQVEAVEELERGPTEVHLRVIHRTSEFVPIFRKLRIMRRFPFTIQGGVGHWVVVASAPQLRHLLARLQERVPAATIEAVHHAGPSRGTGPLTPHQDDLFRRAMAAGYFEVPRKVTLTGLARTLDVAPSTLSEALAVIEKKLLETWPNSA